MHDWSDNELDGMSREAADKYGPGRGVPDWDVLQKQLDKELPEHKEDNRRRFFFLIFLCLVLTGITGYLLISQNSGSTNSENKKLSNASQNHQKTKNDAAETARNNSNSIKNNEDVSVTTNSQKNNAPENKPGDEDQKTQQLTTPGKLSAPSATADKQTRSALSLSSSPQQHYSSNSSGIRTNADRKKNGTKNKKDDAFAITVESSGVNRNSLSETKTEAPKAEPAVAAATGLAEASNAIAPGADATKPGTDKPATDQKSIAKDTVATGTTVKKTNTVKSPPKGSAIEVSVLAGVDASSVKFKYGDNAGFNAGLLLGYRFNRKWSVGTGLIYTKKNYTAAGTDFDPPKSYWTNGIKLDKVDGSCYMWELPVYASYRFNSNQKSGWFISMGLSTYFMTKEDYTYHYKYNNGNPATRYWQNADPSNYWFSILGISGGWEKNIGRGLSLGVAPYAKIPLQGVGFGNMRLSSYGVNLLLTYRKATGRK